MVHTIGMQSLYVFFFISHLRRELVQFNVTASPTAAWIWRQTIEATAWGRQPQHLIHDRDNVYGADFGTKLAAIGTADIRTPYRTPRANSVAERVVRTFRQECLDHVIVLNEQHPRALLAVLHRQRVLGFSGVSLPARRLAVSIHAHLRYGHIAPRTPMWGRSGALA